MGSCWPASWPRPRRIAPVLPPADRPVGRPQRHPRSSFVANGDSDPMILPRYSHLLAGLIPLAHIKIYPDSAYGFLFQHHAEFAADVDALLAAG